MQIGFNAPSGGPLATAESLTRLAQAGEALGYGYATISDHVVIPADIHAKYPYSDSGEFPAAARGERHEQLTQVMFLAAKTTTLRLVTSVMVVPHRPAMLTAKILSTIDVLSAGRLTLGIGAGWLQEEFEALQVPDFAARGKVEQLFGKLRLLDGTKDELGYARTKETVVLDGTLAKPDPTGFFTRIAAAKLGDFIESVD
jgi:alkanesulfonate monooxygenase SsuD/methylene tetrahydromethanopterin reductase-like flavin-dependent oxidoreductase (luciferase family)